MNEQNPSTDLKIPPNAGGPRRVGSEENSDQTVSRPKKVSGLKKAMPYLIAGGTTGTGFLWGLLS